MNTGKLYMLRDSISNYLAVLCNTIEVYLLCILDELAHHDRVFRTYIRCQLQETLQLIAVRADIHCSTRENV